MPAAATPESTEFLQQLQSGQRLAGCYLLIKPIEGAPERTIWLANDEVLAKDVALHFLPQVLAGQADVAERLKQEVKRNRPLIHPHILRTYDFIEEDGWSAISTDAFEGPTMAGLLEDGALEVAEIQPWVEQICSTLQEAHRIRIVHAGLTPNDIVIDHRTEVRLMNFGIAAVIRDALRGVGLDGNGQTRALSYASAEQLRGAKPGVPDDIFALGAVVHELLSGEPPFSGTDRSSQPQTISAHRRAIGHRGDPVPASWERAVSAALSGDPAARPATPSQWWELASTAVASDESVTKETPEVDASAAIPEVAAASAAEVVSPKESDSASSVDAEGPAASIEAPSLQIEESITPELNSAASSPPTQSEEAAEAPSPREVPSTADAPADTTHDEARARSSTPVPTATEALPEAIQPVVQSNPEIPAPSDSAPAPLPVIAPAPRVDELTALETSREPASSPEPTPSAPAPAAPVPSQEKRAVSTKGKRLISSTAADPKLDSARKARSEASQKEKTSERATPGKPATRAIAPVDADHLAEKVRQEEAEEEARELGYFNSGEEVYLPTRRRSGGLRHYVLPIVGAVLGLAALFGVVRMFMGSPDGSHSTDDVNRVADSSTAANSSTSVIPATPTPIASTATSDANPAAGAQNIGNLPSEDPRVDASAGPPETKLAGTPAKDISVPPPIEPPKSAADEHEAALKRVRELEAKVAETKKEIGARTKALPQMLKSADESASQQKRRDEEAKKAELAATQAEQVAAEKRRAADEVKKAATALAEQTKARQDEHAKSKDALASLQTALREDEKALADANAAALAAASAARQEKEKVTSTAPSVPPAVAVNTPSGLTAEKVESAGAKTRNDERRRVEEEMAALRKKFAEQAQKLGAALDTAHSPESTQSAPASAPTNTDTLPTAAEIQSPAKAEGSAKTEGKADKPSKSDSAPNRAASAPALADLALNQTDVPVLPDATPKTEDQPKMVKSAPSGEYMNSLGMKLIPVASAEPLFCIWPTRVRDFETFARTTGLKSTLWKDPGFKQGPEHPVVNVTWQEAIAFCKWLTSKEQKEGLISADQSYRLPTDLEWSIAVGLSNEPGRTPEERDMSVPDVYPWGNSWPPPAGAGNYTGEETGSDVAIKGYDDAFPWTSPVGSFPANSLGLFDMGGNVWEWCMDTWNSQSKARVLRGASWYNGALKLSLLSSCRVHASPDSGTDNYGFRIILAGGAGKPKR